MATRELYPFNPDPELPLFLDVSALYGHVVAGLAKAGLGWRAFDAAMVFMAAGIEGIRYVANRSIAVQATTVDVRADLRQMQERFGPEAKFIIWGNSLNPIHIAQPFSETFMPFIWLNADNMSGLSQKLFRELGPSDFPRAMCSRDDLLVLSNNRGQKDELIERHRRVITGWMQEHHGSSITYREVFRGNGVVAMQCQQNPPQ